MASRYRTGGWPPGGSNKPKSASNLYFIWMKETECQVEAALTCPLGSILICIWYEGRRTHSQTHTHTYRRLHITHNEYESKHTHTQYICFAAMHLSRPPGLLIIVCHVTPSLNHLALGAEPKRGQTPPLNSDDRESEQ